MFHLQLKRFAVIMQLLLVFSPSAHAWGERGHDLIARAAVRIMLIRSQNNPNIKAVFGAKEHMLGHLSNVPDIVWRGINKTTDELGTPTHFIDLEYLNHKYSVTTFPRTLAEAGAILASYCQAKNQAQFCQKKATNQSGVATAGTAPWRVEQFFRRMVTALKAAQVDEALVNAGIMAHFVGDLANPHHTTIDYDGYAAKQGGIHAYFESDIVTSYGFDLDVDVLRYALEQQPFTKVLKISDGNSTDPLRIAVALTFNSHDRLTALNKIDREQALKKPSSEAKGMRIKAERRDAAEVNHAFRSFVIERLALAADTLANLWSTAWLAAGSPNFAQYQSYFYAVAPEFVPPDYLPESIPLAVPTKH